MAILSGTIKEHRRNIKQTYKDGIPVPYTSDSSVWYDLKLGFHTLGWEKRNDSVTEINRAQDTEAMPPFSWLYMSLLQQYRMLRGIHPKSTEIYPDLRWLSHSGYKFQGLFYVNDTAYSSLPNMRIREEYLKKTNKQKKHHFTEVTCTCFIYLLSLLFSPCQKKNILGLNSVH